MATPTIAALSARYPGAEIDVAVGAWTRPAFEGNPRVRGFVDPGGLLGGRRPSGRELLRVAAAIRGRCYDAAVVLERSFWMALLPLLAGVPLRAGLDSGGRGFAHTRRARVPTVARHEARLYLDCAALVDAPPLEPARMELRPGDAAAAAARRVLERAGWRGEQFALLHPGGGSNPGMQLRSKRWPAARFAEVAGRLAASGVRPAVVWGATDVEPAAALLSGAPAGTLAVGAELPLAGLAAAARLARAYVANDSGPTHMAVAVGTPTVAIFGPSDERRFGPFGALADGTPIGEAVAAPLLAADDPAPAWPDRPVEGVTVDQVWAAVERALSKPRDPS
jgi:heptosyltransferase-2